MKKRLLLLVVVLAVLTVPATGQAAGAKRMLTYDQAVDKLIAQGYPQQIEQYLIGLGSTELGNRDAGTAADNEAARYFGGEMRKLGLKVWYEPVPIDVWQANTIAVAVNGKTMGCHTYSCSTPTPPGGLTGEVVYVHDGNAFDYDAIGDVNGKIVLVDQHLDWYFVDLLAKEATLRGAKAVIMSTIPGQSTMFQIGDGALGGGPALGDKTDVPWVFMSRDDSTWLKSQLESGAVQATVTLDATVTYKEDGGVGYNVFASIPGSSAPGEIVVSMSHHDAHFFGACDNTSSMVSQLVMAKAMKMSGYKPKRTMVFLSTTAEESGMTDAYYGWCVGSWYSITHQHTDWPGRVAGIVNLEMIGYKDGVMKLYSNPELTPWLQDVVSDNPDIVGGAGPAEIYDWPWSWTDQWTYTAAGIPSVTMMPWSSWFQQSVYHTQFDDYSQVDWDFLGKNTKLEMALVTGFDRGLLPYSLKNRADHLAAATDESALLGAGADPALVERFVDDVAAFQEVGGGYEARKASIPSCAYPSVNKALMRAEAVLCKGLTGLHPYDLTVYPHALVLSDINGLNAALADLTADPTDADQSAYWALSGVDMVWYSMFFSHQTYLQNAKHHTPGYERIGWGGQGKLPTPLDLWSEVRMVSAGAGASAMPGIEAARDLRVGELNKRLADESRTIECALPIIKSIK